MTSIFRMEVFLSSTSKGETMNQAATGKINFANLLNRTMKSNLTQKIINNDNFAILSSLIIIFLISFFILFVFYIIVMLSVDDFELTMKDFIN